MTPIKRFDIRILKGLFSFGKRKGRYGVQPAGFTKQNYIPFKRRSSQPPSIFRRGLLKTTSLLRQEKKTAQFGKKTRKSEQHIVIFIVCLILIGASTLLYSDRSWVAGLFSRVEYFEVGDNVVIEGCHVTTPAEIRELGEIRYHTNLFSINAGKLSAILVKHPWVSKAEIHRSWPNRLVIDIVEHVPEALCVLGKTGHDQLYYMDAKGVAFVGVRPGQDLDFPVITGLETIGKLERRKEALHDAMQFIKLVKQNNPNLPAQSISEIHLDTTEGMTVYLVEYPFPIYFGRGGVAKKYRQLESVLGALYRQRKDGMLISQVEYIRMDYLENKVLVAQTASS